MKRPTTQFTAAKGAIQSIKRCCCCACKFPIPSPSPSPSPHLQPVGGRCLGCVLQSTAQRAQVVGRLVARAVLQRRILRKVARREGVMVSLTSWLEVHGGGWHVAAQWTPIP